MSNIREERAEKERKQEEKLRVSLSVVIPLYNESESLEQLYTKLTSTLSKLEKNYEIVFVDDGSSDDSISSLKSLRAKDKAVKIFQLQRNYGKATALAAGFKYANGDIIITMDADLQDDPEEIPNFLSGIEEGYDLISGWRHFRQDSLSKRLASKLYNRVTSLMTGIELHDFNCGFKALRREVAQDMDLYGDLHRYVPVLAYWKGYKVGEVQIKHHPRKYGKSKYGLNRFTRGFLDLITVMFLLNYTTRPLHLFGGLGLVSLAVGFFINLYLAIEWFLGVGIGGRPLLILGVLLMIIGIQFISMGLLGEMISHATGHNSRQFGIKKDFD